MVIRFDLTPSISPTPSDELASSITFGIRANICTSCSSHGKGYLGGLMDTRKNLRKASRNAPARVRAAKDVGWESVFCLLSVTVLYGCKI